MCISAGSCPFELTSVMATWSASGRIYAATVPRSDTRYATISAAGKKKRLKMKYPKKLWPLRPATRAGQKAKLSRW